MRLDWKQDEDECHYPMLRAYVSPQTSNMEVTVKWDHGAGMWKSTCSGLFKDEPTRTRNMVAARYFTERLVEIRLKAFADMYYRTGMSRRGMRYAS